MTLDKLRGGCSCAALENLAREYLALVEDARAVVKAGDLLSLAAQTTGGTAGLDEALIEAIRRHAEAQAALRARLDAIEKGEG